MGAGIYLQTLLSLVFVVGLMFGSLALYKKFFIGKSSVLGKDKRMQVLEYLYLDRQRKIIIIRKDDQEITILTSPQGDVVIK